MKINKVCESNTHKKRKKNELEATSQRHTINYKAVAKQIHRPFAPRVTLNKNKDIMVGINAGQIEGA
jgi:hypothetical protein